MDDSLEPVTEHLQEHPHPLLAPEMIQRCATVVEAGDDKGPIVFDVEKRRKTLGARYRDGHPLAAFETYWERYSYSPEDRTLRLEGTNVGSDQTPTVTINSWGQLALDQLESLRNLFTRAWP